MNKQELRKKYLQQRTEISSKQKLLFDDMLLLQFQQLNFSGINSLLTYWPIAQYNEPNTHLFSSYLRHHIPQLQIAYPVCNFENDTMQAVEINEETVYITNKYGIAEPKFGSAINPQQFDLIFVPLLTCDVNGNRVGFGKGFYDKYIAQCNSNVVTMAFNYFEPVAQIDDINDNDIPLCYCITPYKIYEF